MPEREHDKTRFRKRDTVEYRHRQSDHECECDDMEYYNDNGFTVVLMLKKV